MATVFEDKQPSKTTSSSGSWNEGVTPPRPIVQSKQNVQDYEVVFVVDDSSTSQKAFDFALQTAKNFEAKLVLVYTTPRKEVPSGYVEFARVEGIRDYEWHYNNDTSSSKLDSLARKVEEAGVECTTQVHVGDAKSAMDSFVGDSRAIIVLNKGSRRSWFPRSIARLFSRDVTELGVPVMVI